MNIICLDTETTGLSIEKDEILQLSIIDGDGNILLNEYMRPVSRKSWPNAQKIHGISYKDVSNCFTLSCYKDEIEKIFLNADVVVGYNLTGFDLPMLFHAGIANNFKDGCIICDVMDKYASINGEYNEYTGEYKFKKLRDCAAHYGYTGDKWHDALDDARATLFCFYAIFGNPPVFNGYHSGVQVCRDRGETPPVVDDVKDVPGDKKQLTRKQCFKRAFLWWLFTCGFFFPAYLYYLVKGIRTPKTK